MRYGQKLLLVLISALCAGCVNLPAPSAKSTSEAAANRATKNLEIPEFRSQSEFEARVTRAIDDGLSPGLVFVVVDQGEVTFSKGYGFADIEKKKPATPETIFPLGSISKTFIGTAAAIAIQEGVFDPLEPINNYLPLEIDDPRPSAEISFLHLATHTSGIVDAEVGYDAAYAIGEPQHPLSLSEYLASYLSDGGELYDAEANFNSSYPGHDYAYSNVASGLAALALGEKIGIPFEQYTSDRIFKPLGMNSTAWFLSETDEARVAKLYERTENTFSPYPVYSLATWPDGGLRTSASDLTRYLMAFMNTGELNDQTAIDAQAVHLAIAGIDVSSVKGLPKDEIATGLFWGTSKSATALQSRPLIGHNGADPGIWTLMQYDPVMKRGIIAIANADMDTRDDIIAFYSLAYGLFLTKFD